MNDDLLRVKCIQCEKVMFNIEFDHHKCCSSVVRPIIEQSCCSDTGSNPVYSTTSLLNKRKGV